MASAATPALKLSLRFRPQSSSSTPPSTPTQQRSSLADDITVVGGNGTGIFVSHVRQGSAAEQCGLKEGSELLEVRVSAAVLTITQIQNTNGLKNEEDTHSLPQKQTKTVYNVRSAKNE